MFRNEVRPTEIARKLAREMEIHKRVSLSRTYAPTDYLVYLSPEDRSRYAGVEQSIAEELGAYLLEHARRERLVLVRRPFVEFHTDDRLRLGEFGIEARTAPVNAADAPARGEGPIAGREPERPREDNDRPAPIAAADDAPYEDPYAAEPFGGAPQESYSWEDAPEPSRDVAWLDPVEAWEPPAPGVAGGMPWVDPTLHRPDARRAEPHEPRRPAAPPQRSLLVDGTPFALQGDRVVVGRSKSADIVIGDPSVSRAHLELRCDDEGWYAVDLGSTNGSTVGGRPLDGPTRLQPGMRLGVGHADAVIEVR